MRSHLLVAAAAVLFACSHAAPAPAPAPTPARASASTSREWIARSNQNAQVLLDVQAKYAPEFAARTGVSGIDERISDFTPGHRERQREGIRQALATLKERQQGERDPEVSEDLAILVDAAQRQIRGSELHEKLEVPYSNLPRMIFGSIRSLLDPQIAKERRPAALARVRKYAGLDPGTAPVVELVEAEIRDGLAKGLLPPSRIEVENDLHTSQFLVDGIDKLFAQYAIPGHEQPVAALHQQLEQFLTFVQAEVLPKAREDFRLPPELYEFQLRQFGVDIPPARSWRSAPTKDSPASSRRCRSSRKRSPRSATSPTGDYREVIKELKKSQIPDDQVLAFYQTPSRADRGHHPRAPARHPAGAPGAHPARHARRERAAARTAHGAAAADRQHRRAGRVRAAARRCPARSTQKYDDFNYDAAAWTLTAHEARPGHELQFDAHGRDTASRWRARIFAFNSVNARAGGCTPRPSPCPTCPSTGSSSRCSCGCSAPRARSSTRSCRSAQVDAEEGPRVPRSAKWASRRPSPPRRSTASPSARRARRRRTSTATCGSWSCATRPKSSSATSSTPLTFHDTILAQGLLPAGSHEEGGARGIEAVIPL